MNVFDVAVQIVRADAAMLRAGIPTEQRSRALETLAQSIVRAGLDESDAPQKIVPLRRPL